MDKLWLAVSLNCYSKLQLAILIHIGRNVQLSDRQLCRDAKNSEVRAALGTDEGST